MYLHMSVIYCSICLLYSITIGPIKNTQDQTTDIIKCSQSINFMGDLITQKESIITCLSNENFSITNDQRISYKMQIATYRPSKFG